jgi:hypothetical protein
MGHLATKQDYTQIKEVISEFERALNKFKDQIVLHNEILRRYDEVISTKASKINLLELEGNLHN